MTIPLLAICFTDSNGSMPFVEAFKRALATPAVPARTGYWLSKAFKVIKEEAAAFTEQRNNLLQQMGTPAEGQPGQVKLPADKIQDFLKEINSLQRDVDLGFPSDLKLVLPPSFTPEDWETLIALDLFNAPED